MSYFANKKVVVTGGAGFLGRHVVAELRRRGCEKIFVPRSSQYNLVDGDAVRRLYRDASPDLVIHLAAQVGGIGANRDNPGKFFYENLMMGLQLIEEGRKVQLPQLVAAGTICAYPKFAPVPFREDDLWNGYPEETNAPYGLAKKMLLVQSQAYRQQYNFNSQVVLIVNLYGPQDNFDLQTSHAIPGIIRKISDAQKSGANEIVLWGDGTPTREFLFVEDAAEGVLAACEHGGNSDPVNLGCGFEISIAELATKIADLMNYHGRFVYDHSKPNGQPRRFVDITRARTCFGWAAKTPLDQGLRRTIDWWRNQSP